TLILETEFETADGAALLIDFMPMRAEHCQLVRLVRGLRGRVAMEMEFILRFDYGASVPWVTRLDEGIRAIAGPDLAVLRTPVDLQAKDLTHVACFDVAAGETVPFVLAHGPSHREVPPPVDTDRLLAETE